MGVMHEAFELREDSSLLNAVNSWEIHLQSWDFYTIELAWKNFCFQTFRSDFSPHSSILMHHFKYNLIYGQGY